MSDRNQSIPFLVGSSILLRPVEQADLLYIRKWANDPEIRVLTGEVLPMTEAGALAWFDRVQNDTSRVWFIIEVKATGQPIGEAGLLRMFPAWRTTDLSLILGEKEAWGQGFGTQAIQLLLDYAFGALNFHRVSIGVVGFNERALRFYENIGFKQEGIQRDGYFSNHQYHDFFMMSILEDEYRQLHRHTPAQMVADAESDERKDLFNQWAPDYDEGLRDPDDFPFMGYDRVLETIVRAANAQPGMRVLDAGTGTGNLAQRFEQAGCQVWGTDFSEKMIQLAQNKVPTATFILADIRQSWQQGLPEKFDRIVSAYVFHEFDLETKKLLIDEFTQHLSPGGLIVIGDISFPTTQFRNGAAIQYRDRWDENEFYWAADEARQALVESGLEVSYSQVSTCGGVYRIQI